ncbi:MAG: hypothetical protein RLZZ262_1136 [Bacteroidota bacterium]|jgi:hypothetical protein
MLNRSGLVFISGILALLLFVSGCKTTKDSAGNAVKRDAPRSQMLAGVKVTAIRIDKFPKYALDGEAWDAYAPYAVDPDIYLTVQYDHVQIYKSEVLEDRKYGTPIELKAGLPLQLKPFDKALLIELFDEDGVSSNDNMGYFLFNPMDYRDWKFVTLQASDRELSISLALEWEYR